MTALKRGAFIDIYLEELKDRANKIQVIDKKKKQRNTGGKK